MKNTFAKKFTVCALAGVLGSAFIGCGGDGSSSPSAKGLLYTMSERILSLLLLVLAFSSNVLAEWSGDTLRPAKVEGCYQVSTPEEYAWMASQQNVRYDGCFKLVSDIVLGKDKKSVHREHLMKPISFSYGSLDFNGYSVYGAYTEEKPFIICGYNTSYKDISFKNFEIHVKDTSWSQSNHFVSAVRLGWNCIRDVEGNVVAEGAIKVTGDSVSANVLGGSFIDGVLENRTSLTVEANYADITFAGVALPNYYGIDSTRVHEAVNYADVSIKAKRSGGIKVNGVCPIYDGGCNVNENLHKISNYGNITVDVQDSITRGIYIAGIGAYRDTSYNSLLELYNEGNISIKTDSIGLFDIAGLSLSSGSHTYRKFAKAENRGNISVLANRSGYSGYHGEHYIGGCFAHPADSVENLLNEGNLDIHLGDFKGSGGSIKIGGVVGSAGYVKRAMNVGTINVSVNKTPKEESLWYFTGVGGIAGNIGGKIENSANFGTVNTESVEYVGGIVGMLDEADVVKVMNFADVNANKATYLGGIIGALHGGCFMNAGNCSRDPQYLTNMANWGNVTATDSTCKSIGGLAGESYEDFFNSYNAGKVIKNVSTDSVYKGHPFSNKNTHYKGFPEIRFYHTYYNWNVYDGTNTEPEDLQSNWWYKSLFNNNGRTTAHMQSSDFVKELNYVDSTNTNSKVWTLSKLYPYPIIADMEGLLKDGKEKLSIPERLPSNFTAPFNLQTDGLNILVSGAKVGAPYGVFTLLGKSVSRGRISSQNQNIPVAHFGTYIVKVGKFSRKIAVK